MTTDDPAQLLSFLWLCYAAVFLRLGGETAARTRKISVPVGYKFRPTDEDLVNHHLRRKVINVPDDYCLIPEYNHYEAEPWDLISKYNELSDGESDDCECFFFSTNSSDKRTGRSTPEGYWHETSKKKPIEGSDGVTYVMKYFTFYIGRRQKDPKITPWRMREFTDPSNKGFALCKIFKDVDDQKKKNDVGDSVIATMISGGYQNRADSSQEASLDTVVESSRIPTPLSDANLTSHTLVSPQAHPTQFEESQGPTLSSDLNSMNGGTISPHQQQTPNDEGSQLVLNAFADQFLDLDSSGQFLDSPQHDKLLHSKNTLNDGYSNEHANMFYSRSVTSNVVFPASKRCRHRAEETSFEVSQQPPIKKSRTPINHSQDLDLQPSKCGYDPQQTHTDLEKNPFSTNSSFNSSIYFPHKDNILIGNGSDKVNSEEASLGNFLTQQMNFASSNYEEWLVELQATSLPSNCISLDDISSPLLPPEISPTNTEGHSDESTDSLSPSNFTYDKVKFYGVEIHEHEAQQTNQQVLPLLFSPTQFCITPQHKDMQFISKDMSFPDIDDDDFQCLRD